MVHWAIVDLAAPGIELYVRLLIPGLLRGVGNIACAGSRDVVEKERLAVAINGTLFTSNSGWWPRMSGDLADSVETVGGRPRRQSRVGTHVFVVV